MHLGMNRLVKEETNDHPYMALPHTYVKGISLWYEENICPSVSLVSRNKINIPVGSLFVYVFDLA
jgi:hypothetical protein